MIDGHFLLEDALRKANKSHEEMEKEFNAYRLIENLQFSLKVSWVDENGVSSESPEHNWYFDFKRGLLIYKVGGFSNILST